MGRSKFTTHTAFSVRSEMPKPQLRKTADEQVESMGALAGGNFGKRTDGTEKGNGFLGVLKRPDGRVSTELSIGVNFNGRETLIPLLVPTLTREEVEHLLNGGKMTQPIIQKAVDHAKKRLMEKKSPFAQPEESPVAPIYPARIQSPPPALRGVSN